MVLLLLLAFKKIACEVQPQAIGEKMRIIVAIKDDLRRKVQMLLVILPIHKNTNAHHTVKIMGDIDLCIHTIYGQGKKFLVDSITQMLFSMPGHDCTQM